MIAGVGNSHLAITTSSPEAQRWFDQGFSLLHCLWDFEALRAFREAARLDPACAMCQWGLHRAMEFAGNSEDELKAVVSKMKELAPKASDLCKHRTKMLFNATHKSKSYVDATKGRLRTEA